MQQEYVIHAHYDELYRFIYYLVGDTYTANEIVQDTFVKFIQLNRLVEQPHAFSLKDFEQLHRNGGKANGDINICSSSHFSFYRVINRAGSKRYT